jgi:hypothetical protein
MAMNKRALWRIEGLHHYEAFFRTTLPGGYSEETIITIIQRLACRHLTPQEIVSASRERRSKSQDERLVPLIGRKPHGKRTTISISLGFDYIASYWHAGELEIKPDIIPDL